MSTPKTAADTSTPETARYAVPSMLPKPAADLGPAIRMFKRSVRASFAWRTRVGGRRDDRECMLAHIRSLVAAVRILRAAQKGPP